jgi:very-long-chain ceramide synthase
MKTSKTLNYLDSPIVGPYFIFFVLIWIYQRHHLNLKILWAVLTEFRTVGPFVLDWETQQYKCWISQIITFALLAGLQAVNVFWLFLILRIAKNYVFNSVKRDDRSDNEDEDEEDDEAYAKDANGSATIPNGVAQSVARRKVANESETVRVLVNGRPVDGVGRGVNSKKER